MRREPGGLPRGVSLDGSHRGRKKYKARLFYNGKDRFLGRFETAEQALAAYRQAVACLKGEGDTQQAAGSSTDPLVHSRVQALLHQRDQSRGSACSGANGTVTIESHRQYFSNADRGPDSCAQGSNDPSMHAIARQQSLLSSQSGPYEYGTNAGPAGTPAVTHQHANTTSTLPGLETDYPFADPLSDQLDPTSLSPEQLEDVLTAMLLAPPAVEEVQQLSRQQLLLSSCSSIPAPLQQQQLFHEQSLQSGQSCFVAAPVGLTPVAAIMQSKKQLLQQQDLDLQQLLHCELQKALQESSAQTPSMVPAQHAASASPATCSSTTTSGGGGGGVSYAAVTPVAAADSPAAAPSIAAAPVAGGAGPAAPAITAAQSGGLAAAQNCLDAVMYIAACVRAVLDLHVTLLSSTAEDDAAAAMMRWLAAFRQQQQHNLSTPAATAQPTDVLHNAVLQLMAQVVRLLTTSSGSSNSSISTLSSSSGSVMVALAQRSFVVAVLERLEDCMLSFHKLLRMQISSAQPEVIMQLFQGWLQGLQVQQANSPEGALVLRLAVLL